VRVQHQESSSLAFEHALDLLLTYSIEIFWHGDLSGHKIEATGAGHSLIVRDGHDHRALPIVSSD
jgi:hypothetical protein